MSSRNETQQQRLLRTLETLVLTGVAPLYYGGVAGAYHVCPACDAHWSIDPTHQLVGQMTLHHSSFSTPLIALCRPCSRLHRAGALEIDEYGQGRQGYGFNWESHDPPGAHILMGLLRQEARIVRPATISLLAHPELARHRLSWLADYADWPEGIPVPADQTQAMAQENPPGAGLHWQGFAFSLEIGTPLEEQKAGCVCAVALPPSERLQRDMALRLCQLLARLCVSIHCVGEPCNPAHLRASFSPSTWIYQRNILSRYPPHPLL